MENKKTTIKSVLFLLCIILSFNVLNAQKHHAVLKDSLDGAFDLSDFLIYANGFIVVPTIITEPAVGGFGAAVAPIFLKKRAPVIEADGRKRFVNPDITGGLGMYTANKSWMVGAFRSATLVKPKILYRAFAAYGDMNLSFYANNLPNQKDEEFKLNFKSTIFYTQWLKQFNNAKWSVGPQYLFLNSKINLPDFNLPPPFVDPKDIKSTISQLGAALQFDGRDNIFTPDKGIRLQSDFFWSDKALGSDYQAWRINFSAIGYYPLAKTLIGGLRIEGEQALGSPPFYLKPGINMRGIPAARYMGNTSIVSELEFRWDLYRRWSLMGYGGLASAFNDWDQAFAKPIVYSYGTGFRYLIARKFKLRMGVDVARGPEEWAYYIVFGSNWMR
ncbi:BamA/TamA family outer membrane protein [Flavobacterium tyrosinilyticum]|uniref:BamA/TamA family outer membrane protein n=1 Tax=Flavobacterium tyrosinilyticum TaxID=1658740 RepID=UPI0020300C04|nr:BamA/TamA family outer membrane protein [Flavobacterium tyrosinilyticum]MCM0665297.1 BamA/TamA family outer membrane protein [Flavobacterium tyrosinilyticum]